MGTIVGPEDVELGKDGGGAHPWAKERAVAKGKLSPVAAAKGKVTAAKAGMDRAVADQIAVIRAEMGLTGTGLIDELANEDFEGFGICGDLCSRRRSSAKPASSIQAAQATWAQASCQAASPTSLVLASAFGSVVARLNANGIFAAASTTGPSGPPEQMAHARSVRGKSRDVGARAPDDGGAASGRAAVRAASNATESQWQGSQNQGSSSGGRARMP